MPGRRQERRRSFGHARARYGVRPRTWTGRGLQCWPGGVQAVRGNRGKLFAIDAHWMFLFRNSNAVSCVFSEFIDGNAVASNRTKCCCPERSKQHFCAYSAIAESLSHGANSASRNGVEILWNTIHRLYTCGKVPVFIGFCRSSIRFLQESHRTELKA